MNDLNDPNPTLEADMRAWLRAMVDAVVLDPIEREARYAEIEEALNRLDDSNGRQTQGHDSD